MIKILSHEQWISANVGRDKKNVELCISIDLEKDDENSSFRYVELKIHSKWVI